MGLGSGFGSYSHRVDGHCPRWTTTKAAVVGFVQTDDVLHHREPRFVGVAKHNIGTLVIKERGFVAGGEEKLCP